VWGVSLACVCGWVGWAVGLWRACMNWYYCCTQVKRCKTKKVPSAKNISSVEYMFDSFLNLSSNDGMDNRQWQASCEQMHLGLQLHLVDYLALLSQGLFYTVCSTWQWPAPQLDQCHLLLQIVWGSLDQIQAAFPVIHNARVHLCLTKLARKLDAHKVRWYVPR